MDPFSNGFSHSLDEFEPLIPGLDNEIPDFTTGFELKDDVLNLDFLDNIPTPPDAGQNGSAPNLSFSCKGEVSCSDSDASDPVLKFISQMLMEEHMEDTQWMLHDSLALHVAEKSFYDVLGEKYTPSPNQPPLFLDSPDESSGFSDNSWRSSCNTSNDTSDHVDPHPQYVDDIREYQPPFCQTSGYAAESTLDSGLHLPNSLNEFSGYVNGPVDDPISLLQAPNIFSESEYIMHFRRGVEEASKFLPKNNNLIVDLEQYSSCPEHDGVASTVDVKIEKDEREHSPNGSRGRKREDRELEEERINKQSAVYVEETDLSDMFDKVLLYNGVAEEPPQGGLSEILPNEVIQISPKEGESHRGKNGDKKSSSKNKTVDLRTLLILCAQAVSSDDRRTASELLKQMRQHSSPTGDGSQRLAHCFANALEARLAGNGTQVYTALASKRTSAADMLKAYQVYLQACPFKKISIFFANRSIYRAAKNAKALHIIDFGILYGFQWPVFIQFLSSRAGGPPKLRITGIELPQPGFRPAARVQETGHRLAKYCKRFNVPFEYTAIAQKWETIQIENLKIDKNEFLAVNCLYRFENLLDETVLMNSPKNAVLNLVRKMNPDIFTHAIINGSYNAPFFVTRFREALFHYTSLFDMFDTTIPRDNPERLMFEKEFFEKDVVNVIACEGTERVGRPETYKQWQVRNTRAGFQQLSLDRDVMDRLRAEMKAWYHKDFVIDEDGCWLLLGWKGRIVYASSCWVPT